MKVDKQLEQGAAAIVMTPIIMTPIIIAITACYDGRSCQCWKNTVQILAPPT